MNTVEYLIGQMEAMAEHEGDDLVRHTIDRWAASRAEPSRTPLEVFHGGVVAMLDRVSATIRDLDTMSPPEALPHEVTKGWEAVFGAVVDAEAALKAVYADLRPFITQTATGSYSRI